MEYLIENTTILPISPAKVISQGSIGWSDGIITYIGKEKHPDRTSYDNIIDGSDLVIMPGLINSHFHSTSTLLKGFAQDVPEIQWMNKALGPFVPYLTRKDRLLGSQLAVAEGILTGTTAFAEYTRGVVDLWENVYQPLGIRMIAAETINEISSDRTRQKSTDLYELDYTIGSQSMTQTRRLIEIDQRQELLTALLGPQALDMVTPERLSELQELSAEQQLKIHMHVAQGNRERLQIEARYGTDSSTISVLDEMNYLNDRLVAAHCHDTTEDELTLMSSRGVAMVSCQSSIGMIDGIVPPLYEYSSRGGLVSIGTDQVPGVGHANLFREMRMGSLFAKVVHRDPTVLPPWKMLRLATFDAARVFGLETKIGSLEVGKSADLIGLDKNVLSLAPLTTAPLRNIIPNLVYSATGYEVRYSFVNGRSVLENGKLVDLDLSSLRHEATLRANEILEEAETDWREVGSDMVRYADTYL